MKYFLRFIRASLCPAKTTQQVEKNYKTEQKTLLIYRAKTEKINIAEKIEKKRINRD